MPDTRPETMTSARNKEHNLRCTLEDSLRRLEHRAEVLKQNIANLKTAKGTASRRAIEVQVTEARTRLPQEADALSAAIEGFNARTQRTGLRPLPLPSRY